MTTATDISLDEQRALDVIRTRLVSQFPETDSAAIYTAIDAAYRRFDGRRIRDFVPLFVERSARAILAE